MNLKTVFICAGVLAVVAVGVGIGREYLCVKNYS